MKGWMRWVDEAEANIDNLIKNHFGWLQRRKELKSEKRLLLFLLRHTTARTGSSIRQFLNSGILGRCWNHLRSVLKITFRGETRIATSAWPWQRQTAIGGQFRGMNSENHAILGKNPSSSANHFQESDDPPASKRDPSHSTNYNGEKLEGISRRLKQLQQASTIPNK